MVLLAAALAGWLLLADEQGAPPSGPPPAAHDPAQPAAPRVDAPTPLRPGPGPGAERPGAGVVAPPAPLDPPRPGPAPAGPVDVAVRGRVIDPDGRPIPGAEVIAGGLRGEALGPVIAVADPAGRFTLESAPPTGLIEVVAERFARRVLSVEPGMGPIDVVLAPARVIEGQVLAVEDDRPLEGALVEGESATWRNRVRTGADGRFRFDDAPEEPAMLVVTLAGRKGEVVEASASTTVHLSRGRQIRGQVVGPDGAPVPNAMVFVLGAHQLGHPHAALADQDGRFELTGIGDDEAFSVLAYAFVNGQELGTPLDPGWIEPFTGDEVVTRLQRARVVEVTGAPANVVAALVPVSCPPGVPAGAPRGGQPDGAALRFQGVFPGAWQLEVGGRLVGPVIEVPEGDAGQPVRVPWPAEPPRPAGPPVARVGPVRVRVVDETGRPVQGATVVVSGSAEEGEQVVRQSGPDGVVDLREPPAGVLVVTASIPGRVLVAPATLDDETPPGEVRLVLARPVKLAGRVQNPVPGAMSYVTVIGPDGGTLRATEAQPDGRFELSDLPPGPVTVEVLGDGCVPVEMKVELPLAGELVVPLEPMGEMHEHHDGDGHDHGFEGGKG